MTTPYIASPNQSNIEIKLHVPYNSEEGFYAIAKRADGFLAIYGQLKPGGKVGVFPLDPRIANVLFEMLPHGEERSPFYHVQESLIFLVKNTAERYAGPMVISDAGWIKVKGGRDYPEALGLLLGRSEDGKHAWVLRVPTHQTGDGFLFHPAAYDSNASVVSDTPVYKANAEFMKAGAWTHLQYKQEPRLMNLMRRLGISGLKSGGDSRYDDVEIVPERQEKKKAKSFRR